VVSLVVVVVGGGGGREGAEVYLPFVAKLHTMPLTMPSTTDPHGVM
jgi:hypothetical protein